MYVLGIVLLIVGLLLSVALHEFGHLIPAKLFGVKVPQYFVGFGRTLFSRNIRGTEYGVKAIPLGGYVRLVGMYPPARTPDKPAPDGSESAVAQARRESLAEIAPGEEHRAFYNLSVPRKIVVMLGGPLMNLLFAAVLMIVVFVGVGIPTYSTAQVGNVVPCLPASYDAQLAPSAQGTAPAAKCQPGEVAGPAALAGLKAGDKVVSWNGRNVTDWASVQEAIAASPVGEPANVTVERDGLQLTLQVTPALVSLEGVKRSFVGVSPAVVYEPQSVGDALRATGEGTIATAKLIVRLPAFIANAAGATVGLTERDPGGVMGLVGIGRAAGEVASADGAGVDASARVAGFLSLLASLNLSLFVFNLLPILPLDGGHILGALWEGARKTYKRITGRGYAGPTDTAKMLPLTTAVVYVLVGLMILLVVADVVAPAF